MCTLIETLAADGAGPAHGCALRSMNMAYVKIHFTFLFLELHDCSPEVTTHFSLPFVAQSIDIQGEPRSPKIWGAICTIYGQLVPHICVLQRLHVC